MAHSRSGIFRTRTTGLPGIRNEVFALTVVLVLAVLSWQMINAVVTSLYRQYGQALLAGYAPGRQGVPQLGRIENGIRARLSEIVPATGNPLGASLLGLAEGTGGWLDQLARHVGEPMQYATLGQLLALTGNFGRAADQFATAAGFYGQPGQGSSGQTPPGIQVQLWQEEVLWRLASGEVGRARGLAQRYAAAVRPGTREAEFFGMVKAIPAEFE